MNYKDLGVFQKSYLLALEIHKLRLRFPSIEQRELASQLRRSSKSIPANIAEGMGKSLSSRDIKRYLRIALGSNDETKTWLMFSKDLGYIDDSSFNVFTERYEEVGKMLWGLIHKVK